VYKQWVPSCVRAEHQRLIQKLGEYKKLAAAERRADVKQTFDALTTYQERKLAFVERLINHDEMKSVWKKIGALQPTGREPEFVDACRDALFYHQATTKKKAMRHARRIAVVARALAKALQPTNDNVFGPDVLYSLLPASDLPVIGVISVPQATSTGTSKTNSLQSFACDYMMVESDHGPLKGATLPDTGIMLPTHPTVRSLLNRLADHVEASAERYGDDPLTITKPREKSAPRTYFIKSLTQYLRKTYQEPLRGIVVSTVAVVFDDDSITEGIVRAAAR